MPRGVAWCPAIATSGPPATESPAATGRTGRTRRRAVRRLRRQPPLVDQAISLVTAGRSLFGRHDVARRGHAQRIDATAVGAYDAEFEPVDAGGLAAARQPAELLHEQPGDGVEALFLGKVRAEVFVELIDARHP